MTSTAPAKAESPDDQADVIPLSTVQEWTTFEGKTTALLQHRLELPAGKIKDGDTVLVRAVAWDTRDISDWGLDLKPQQTASGWASIRIVAEEKKAAATLEQLDGLRAAIRKILEMQFAARNQTVKIPLEKEAAKAAASAEVVRRSQTEIQKSSIDLARTIPAKDADERAAIKRVLNQLAFNEMLEAVQQCDGLVKLSRCRPSPSRCPSSTSSRTGSSRPWRKSSTPPARPSRRSCPRMKKHPGGNLPDDEKKKLEEAKKKLDELLEQQKKVVEASENLAKKPVENFSEKEEQLLKKLAATGGRPGEVHEGAALRLEQAPRPGLLQRLAGQGSQRDPDRAEDGGGRLVEESRPRSPCRWSSWASRRPRR